MASRGIVYKSVTESAWPSVHEIVRKFETLGLQSKQPANEAKQSLVANGLTRPKECGSVAEEGKCFSIGRRPGGLTSLFGKGTYDRRRMASETTAKLTCVLDDTSFVCPCCQRCYRCPVAAAAKAAGYNGPCTGKHPGDLSAQFGRETRGGRRTAPETAEKLPYVMKNLSLVCPRCQRRYRCPFADAAKAAQNTEPKEITLREKTVKRSNGT